MFEMVLLGSFLWRPFLDPVEGVVKPVIEVCKLAAIGASVFMTNPVQIMFLANLIGPVRGPSPPPHDERMQRRRTARSVPILVAFFCAVVNRSWLGHVGEV